MADPMKIRAQMKGDVAEIRVLMGHPMTTGDKAHFIQTLTVEVGGKLVIDGQTSTSISRNPVFGFKVKGVKAGDKVVVNWVDNKGDKRTDEATIA